MTDKKRQMVALPIRIGGMYSAGPASFVGNSSAFDQATIPDGKAFDVANFVNRSGRWETSPQWAATSITTMNGAARWEDLANNATRMVAIVGAGDVYLQAAAANTFSSVGVNVGASTIADTTNYHGLLFISANSNIQAFDGSNLTTNALGGETFYADTLTTFLDRIFLGRLTVSIANQLTVAQSYDPTSSWATSNVTAEKITNGTTIVGRITPTNSTTASLYLKDIYTVAAATKDTFLRYWCDLRNTSAVYAVPVKIEAYYSQAWATGTAYSVGAIRVPTAATGNGYRYRCTVAGNSDAATEPTWPTTVGTTVTDNTVTWICDGTDACGSLETTIDNISDEPNFTRNSVLARVAPNPTSTKIGIRIVYGNTQNASFTLTSLEMSFRDGKTDGNLTKANRGQQLTVGRFAYDFFNQESSATASKVFDDRVYWTETSDFNDVRGENYYKCEDVAGQITAAEVVSGRLVVFKQRGMWVFQGTGDANIPIRLERFYDTIGCSGPKAIATLDDTMYFIGGDEIYSWKPSTDPVPLAREAMREALFSGTVVPTRLAIDYRQKEVWVSGSSATAMTAIYNLRSGDWVRRSTPTASGNRRVFYAPNTSTMFMWPASGTLYTHDGATTTDPTAAFTAQWTPRYLRAPDGYDLHVSKLRLRYIRSAGDSTLAVAIKYYVGSTVVSKSVTVTLPNTGLSSAVGGALDILIPVVQTGNTFAFTFTFTPSTVDGKFSVSDLIAECAYVPAIPAIAPTTSGSL